MDASLPRELEREFRTGGVEAYERSLAADCLMVFAPPVGIMSRDQVIPSMSTAPRWRRVAFEQQRALRLHDSVTMLAYAVSAQRAGERAPYRASVLSTYRRRAGAWELVFHRQFAQPPA